MKAIPLFVPLLAVVATSLCFHSPAPTLGAQARGQAARKTDAEPRIALVIGNGAYAEAPLANPVNDARDMAATLRQLGFEVLSGENLNHRQMENLIREFGRKIRGGGVGMFYFAGHGAQVGGANYLIPVGAEINGEAEVKYEAVDAGFVLAQMEEARNRLNIVILDACRNNPFARSFRSSSRGLASIDAPAGTLIAYATAPGRTASDGSGRNGLYTKELLAAMRSPGLKIEDVFKRTRAEVLRQSNNQQIPWEASSIVGDFYFSAERLPSTGAAAITAPTRPEDATTTRMSVAGVPLTAMSFTTAQVNAQGQVVNQRQEQCWGYVDDLGAGAKLEMVEIPAGEFLMGEDATVLAEFEMDCRRYWDKDTCAMSAKSETPQLRVRVNGFLMGKYEVTQRQWKAVMGSLPPAMNHLDAKLKGDDLPVVYVSWDEIQTFLQKLGRGYRLPSEAEWEYAARAGTRTAFAFGPTVNTDVVNYSGGAPFGQAAKGVYRGRPVAVGGLGLANAWGLYDMHGNVLELCEDNWRDSHNGAPLDGRAWVDISAGASSRVIRGCGWDDPARNCRSASRSKMPGDRAGIVGFRLSRTAR